MNISIHSHNPLRSVTAAFGFRGRGCRFLGLITALVFGVTGLRGQQPIGGTVVAGTATIATAPGSTTITAGNNSVLRWNSFDVGTGQTVRFIQPGANARVMNWIGNLAPSQINGTLLANGQVYLLNPAGVYFGGTAVVDVGRLYAIGGSLSKEDFLAGLNRFTNLTGTVRNDGALRGSAVALVGRTVLNTGTIVSADGFVALGAGNEVLIGRNGSSIYVDAGRSAAPGTPVVTGTAGVANTGTIDAGRGSAILAAGDLYSVAITQDGKLSARDVQLQGQGRGDVLVSGTINASTTTAGETGGSVTITGEHVGLLAGASIEASGPAGGGTILVGGDLHGANSNVRNAAATWVADSATIRADATTNGNGGKVIVWADGTTRFGGAISAQGGIHGGDGGFVEVSGHDNLVFLGGVLTSAPAGLGGTLLLDPSDITINAAGPSATVGTGPNFQSTAISSVLKIGNTATAGTLLNALANNGTVTVTTGSAGAQNGDITIADPISFSSLSTSGRTLVLNAHNNINVNGALSGGANSFNLTLNANNNTGGGSASGTGSVFITQGVNTGGGTFSASGVGFSSSGAGAITTQGGQITLNLSGNVSLGAQLSSAATGATGGPGGNNVAGTPGDDGIGGAITIGAGTLTVTGSGSIISNGTGGAGGDGGDGTGGNNGRNGGNGGTGTAGAITVNATTVDLQAGSTISANGAGGKGGNGGNGASGGNNGGDGGDNGDGDAGAVTLNTGGSFAGAISSVGTVSGLVSTGGSKTGAGSNGSPGAAGVATAGVVTLNNSTAVTASGNSVTGASLVLQGPGDVGTSGARFSTATPAVVFSKSGGTAFVSSGAVDLGGTSTGSAALNLSATGAITQSTALVAPGTLTLSATGHNVTLSNSGNNFNVIGASGQDVTLKDLNGLVLGASTVTGDFDVSAGGGGALAQNAAVSVTGTTTLRAAAANTDIDLSTAANNFASTPGFGGTETNVRDFLYRNDNGSAALPAVGAMSGLRNLLINLPNSTINLSGTVTSTGTQTYQSAANLAADTTLGSSGNITFSSTVGGAHALVVNTAGTTAFNGTVNGLTSVTTDAAGGTTLASSVTTTGAQTYNDAVTLGGNATLSGTALTLGNTLSGSGNDLTLAFSSGNPVDGAVIGGVRNLTANTGTATLSGTVTTSGTQTYNAAVTLGADATLVSSVVGAAGNITFNSTVDGAHNLVVDTAGTTAFNGTVSGVTSLTTDAPGSTALAAAITTTGAQTYNDTVSIETTTAVLSTTNSAISFNGSVNSHSGAGNSLTLSTGTATLAFASTVGGTDALGTLTITNTALGGVTLPAVTAQNLSVSTQGTIGQSAALTIPGTTSLTAIGKSIQLNGAGNNFNIVGVSGQNVTLNDMNGLTLGASTVTGNFDVSVGAGGLLNENGAVSVTGTTTLRAAATTDVNLSTAANDFSSTPVFGGTETNVRDFLYRNDNASAGLPAIGVMTGLRNLLINLPNSTINLSGTVTTTGTQTYQSAASLAADATLVSSGAGAAGNITFNSTAGGAHNLTVNTAGTTDFNGTVNGVTSVTTDAAGSTTLGASVTTTGAQTYNDAVTLGGNTTLTGTALGLGSTLAGAGNDLTLAFSSGNAVNGAVVGGVRNLTANTGATTLSGTITTSGTQTYNTATTLGADATLVSSGAGAAGNITFNSTIGGAHNLVVNTAGTTAFIDTVSGVSSLTTDAAGGTTLAAAITTTGTQSYNDAVTLSANLILTGTSLSFGSTLAGGGNDLTLMFSVGNILTGAGISAVRNLATSVGPTTLSGSITTTGTQTYNTAVTLAGDTILTGTTLGLGSTLNGANHDLTLAFSTGNTVTPTSITAVKNLTTNSGATTLSGGITTSGTQTYNTAVTLAGNTTLTGTALTLGSTFSGANNDLTLAFSTGDAVNGAVIAGVKNLATNSGATTLTGAITTGGTQTYNTAATLSGNTTLTGTALTWGSTLAGAGHDLTLAFSTGDAVNGAVITGVKNLATSSGVTTLTGAITTSGTQTYNTAATLSGNTTLTGTALTLGSTLAGGNNDLTLAFSTGDVVNGAVISGVKNLATNSGATTLTGAITTTGTQTYNTAATLSGNTTLTGTALTWGSTLAGAGHDLALAFSTGDAVNGAVITGVKNLATSSGATTLTGAITTTGTQTYNTAATLSGDATLTGTALSWGSTLAGAGHDLTLAFSTGDAVNGAVITGVKNLVTSSGTTTLTGAITTTGTQNYTTATTLAADVTLASTGVGAAGNITLGSTVSGANNLTVNTAGTTTFNGAVSGVTSVTTDAPGGTTLLATITTSGTQAYNDPLTLGGNMTLTGTTLSLGNILGGASNDLTLAFSSGNLVNGTQITGVRNLVTSVGPTTLTGAITTSGTQTYNTAVTLGGNTTLTGTALDLGSTLSGAGNDLTLAFSTGNTLTGAGIIGVKNLTTNVGLTTLSGAITTSGAQTYNTAATLAGDSTLTGSALNLGSTLTGAGHDLTLAFSSGNLVNGAVVGGVQNLATTAGPTTLTGPITTSGTQTYGTAVTLSGNTTLTGTALSLGSTLAGAGYDLTLSFTLGDTLTGAGVTGLKNLTTNVGPTTLSGGITTTGTQTYNTAVTLAGDTTLTGTVLSLGSTLAGGGSDLTLAFSAGNTLTSAGINDVRNLTTNVGPTTLSGPITTTGTQTYNTAVTLAGNTTLTGTALTLGSTLTGANHDLTMAFSSGNVVDPAVIGGLKNLTTSAGPTTLTGAITTTGTQTYNTATTLAGDTTLTGTALSLGSTLAGAGNDLTLAFSTGNVLTSAGITGVKNLTTSVGATTLAGAVTTTGTQTYNTAVTLSGDTVLTGTVLTLGSTLAGGGNDLTLAFSSGNTVNGSVFTGIKNLTTNVGPTTLFGVVTTSGTQTYNTAATLGGNTTLIGTTLNFGSTLAGGGNDLALIFSAGNTVNGTGITGVRNLSTSGGPTALTGPITTSGTQTYNTATTLTGNTMLSTTNSGVSFGSSVNSASGGRYDLTVSTGTALASFGGAVGGATGGSLGALSIDNTSGTGVALPAITAQSLNVLTAGPVTNAGNLAIAGAATIDVGAVNPITLGTTTAANFGSLALTGGNITIREGSDMEITNATASNLDLTTTAGAVRIDAATASLLLHVNSAAATSLGVVSAGSLDISAGGSVTDDNGPLTVAGATSIVSRTNGDIILDNPGNDFFTGTFTGNTITLTDANALILEAVLAQGQFTANAAGLLTVATTLNGASNVSLISNGSNVLLNSPVSSSGGNILVQAGQDVIQSAPISTTAASGSITIQAGGNAQLVGLSTAGGAVTVTAGNGAQFGSALTMNGPFSVTAGTGGVTFAQPLDGGGGTSDLTVNTSGGTLFSAAIGAGTALHSLTTDAGGTTTLSGGSVRAGAMVFGDNVVVTRDTTFTGGTANFKSAISASADGAQALLLDVSGDAIFGGAVGPAGARFSSLTTTAGGRVLLNGGGVNTTGVQTYNDAVVLGADAVLSSAGAGSAGNIALNSTVDGPFALTVNTAGTTGFGGNVGGTAALAGVTTDAAGTTVFNVAGGTAAKPTVKTTGAQSYNDPITLTADTALNSTAGNITLQQAVSGADKAFALIAPQGTVMAVHNLGDENARLDSLAVNSRDLVVGEDIWAKGDIALGIGSGSSQTENDFLRFNLDGAAARNTRIDSLTGEIILGGGAAGSPVKTGAPLRSSLFKGNDGDLYLFAHKITVQPYERMAVRNGSLVAIADGTAAADGITLSNTAVSNYLVLASSNPGAPGIAIRSRGPADIYQTQGDAVIPDLGTDLIAGAVLFFDARFGVLPTRTQFAPTPAASSDPTFFDYATRTGNILANGGALSIAILPDSAGVTHNVFVADLLVTNPFRPLRPNLAYLDLSTASGFGGFRDGFIGSPTFGVTSTADVPMRTLVATGAQIRNTPEQVFTPDVPRKDRDTAPPEADLTSGVREQLQALGIYARALRKQERVSRERRAGLFVTVPATEHPQVSDYEVADARVEDRAVREVIRLATAAGLLGQGQERLNAVSQALAVSFDAFSATSTSGSAHDYRVWLEARHDSDATQVLQYIGLLRSALTRIELLGLTHQELEGSKAQIYGSILRSRLNTDPEFLRELVQDLPSGRPVAFLPVAAGRSGLVAASP
ncbi:MAG TPA: filamentous hemagglutinin N-terminal domain-containing protein [Lacunisphaera sp.]